MFIFTVIAFTSLIIAVVAIVMAVRGKRNHYWTAAAAIYIFSFLAGFSIGQLTVGITFVLVVLALGYSLKLIKTHLQLFTFLFAGMATGILLVMFVDDYWLFYPFTVFF